MATKTTRKNVQAEPEPEANGTRDYGVYASKPISNTMRTFADWLIDVTGIELPNQRAEDNFRRGVALGGTLRMDFQRSDFWRDHPDNPRSDNYQGSTDEEEKPKTKATTRRGRKAEPEPEPEDVEDETDEVEDEDEDTEPEPEPKPTPRTRRSGRKPAAAKDTTRPASRRRPGAKAAASETDSEPADEEAPY